MTHLDERSKALYQPWNEDGFSADLIVRSMTPVQRWIYRTLLQHAFVCSERPRLPNDDRLLWRMAGCESKDQWLDNKEVILEMFQNVTIEGKELLTQPRLEEDWTRIQAIREKRVDAGRKGGESKASKS
jgi:uncharacterized protein YdaU (DUF1376 family)